MGKCLVPGCPNKYDQIKHCRKMTFFRVPNAVKQPQKLHLAKQWLDFCGLTLEGFPFGAQLKTLCEKHFRPEDLEEVEHKVSHGYRRKRVKAGAVPRIYNTKDPVTSCQVLYGPTACQQPSVPPHQSHVGYREDIIEEDIDVEYLKEDESPYVSSFVPEQLDRPLTQERKEASDLTRWPPDLKILASDLNPVLTCAICKSYFYNAMTITVCLHTFCKGCVVAHFQERLNCPTCNILVHPSDPFVNIKSDTILQDLVYKIFPQRLQHDKKDEADFYISQGLNPPEQKTENVPSASQSQDKKKVKLISVRLDYAGTTPSLPSHEPLVKNFLRIPNNVTIGMIVKFLHIKMHLTLGSQAALFINCFMLNESLTVSRLEEIFGDQIHEQYGDMVFLQYGVIPKADYFDSGLLVSTKYL